MSNKESKDSAESGTPPIPDELIDQLLGGTESPKS